MVYQVDIAYTIDGELEILRDMVFSEKGDLKYDKVGP